MENGRLTVFTRSWLRQMKEDMADVRAGNLPNLSRLQDNQRKRRRGELPDAPSKRRRIGPVFTTF